jgi:hypothetical protein
LQLSFFDFLASHYRRARFFVADFPFYEQRFAYWGAVAVAVLEVLSIGTVVWGILQMRKRKYERIGGNDR